MKTKKSPLVLTAIALAFALAFTACPIGPEPVPPEPVHIHQWGAWSVTTAATCSLAGVETRICAIDPSHTETQIISIDPNAHVPGSNSTITKPATCDEDGAWSGTCALNSSHVVNNAVIPKLGHNWGDWTETTPATTTTDGEETRTCTRDATHKETRPIPKLPGTDPTLSLVEMVHVTGGTFTMGSSDNLDKNANPPHAVTLSPFSMGKYEVTQAQYQEVMGTNPSNFSSNPASGETQNKRPVERVSWYDALVFCNKLSVMEGLTPAYSINGSTDPAAWGTVPTSSNTTWNAVTIVNGSTGYRLPTEAQWEYACRAGTTTPWHSGTETTLTNYAWISTNSDSKTHEVGKKQPNAWGLYDMHGNVWEWCWDWYGTYLTEAQTDPVGASSGSARVRRGGSCNDAARFVRSAVRISSDLGLRGYNLGFRLLRPAQ
jgi:formylglycine-generating enzyme required for sulfatase activity